MLLGADIRSLQAVYADYVCEMEVPMFLVQVSTYI